MSDSGHVRGGGGSAPEIAFSEGVPIPPSVRPVILLSGSDYEMGCQWSKQYAQVFGPWILESLRCDIGEDERPLLQACERHIEEHTPECVELMKGMVAGATEVGVSLTYEDVVACFAREEHIIGTDPDQSELDWFLPPRCSGLAAWGGTTKDGRLLCLGLGDYPEVKFEITVLAYPAEGAGNAFILSPYTLNGKPSHPGMNSKGLAYVHHGAGTSGREHRREASVEGSGVPTLFGIMHTLRFADSAGEALELQLSYAGHSGGLWVDTGGDAFNLECRDPLTVRRPGDAGETDFLYASNNILFESEAMEPFVPAHPDYPTRYVTHAGYLADWVTISSVPRNLEMWNMLHNYRGEVDLEFLKMMCRFGGDAPDYPTLEEAEATYESSQGAGWDAKICNLSTEMVGIMVPDKGEYYVSSFSIARGAQANRPGGYYYPVAPVYSLYQLKLVSGPGASVWEAKERARRDLYQADQELRKLTYWDTPYAPLKEVFERAATEWVKGDYYAKRADRLSGSAAVLEHGRALRCYCRSQAYANQVHESLVTPPVDPSGLGLREWFGSWGEWATA